MNIIVNADDFGTNTRTNEAIIELIRAGKVTSASILANGDDLAGALAFAAENKHISFGAHLNCSCGYPIAKKEKISPLLKPDGKFRFLTPSSRLHHEHVEAIWIEWQSQLDLLIKAGLTITHVDSECHLHTHPRLFPLLARIRRQYGITCIRNTKNISVQSYSRVKRIQKNAWSAGIRYLLGYSVADGFTSLEEYVQVSPEAMAGHSVIELMVHPWGAEYAAETEMLRAKSIHELFGPARLINYHELVRR